MTKVLKRIAGAAVIVGSSLAIAACATAPKTPEQRQELQSDAQEALQMMKNRNPNVGQVLDQAYGYAVFPRVGKAGAIAGGAYGKGVVYERGQLIGYAELTQASVGAQLGAQQFAELIVFDNRDEFLRFKSGSWTLSGTASAIILETGRAQSFDLAGPEPTVIVMPRAGAMVDVSIAGQEIDFTTTPI